jgi:uncharacterized protein YjeT (DUF2065 family)
VSDFLAALGLLLVIEGVVSAAFPNVTRAAMLAAAETPSTKFRLVGLASAVLGIALVWIIRG